MSGSSSRSEDSVYSSARAYCKHGACKLLRSTTIAHPGRRFWRCPFGGKMGDCKLFQWYEEEYEGKAREALIDCIRKGDLKLEFERKEAAKKLEEMKEAFEMNIALKRADYKSLKKDLKAARRRICVLYCTLFLFVSIWLIWLFLVKGTFAVSSRRCLPR